MVQIYADLGALSRAAAEIFVARARRAVADHGQFSVALSGGHTPGCTYELLSRPPYGDQVPWNRMHVFWGDERCVPPDDPRSNERMARLALLDHVPIPAEQIHPMRCAGDAAKAAQWYEATLRAFFAGREPRFDLVLLGLGENGHTASLFPETSALDEQEHWAADVAVAGEEFHRITLTPPLINQAAAVMFLITGASKAGILQAVLQGPCTPHRLPAQIIRPVAGETLWLVDRDAGRLVCGEAG